MTHEGDEISKVRFDGLQRQIDDWKIDTREALKQRVTRDEFEPIKRLVYGVVSLILIAVVTGILTLVLR